MNELPRYLREHPNASRQEAMRATGMSARALRAAEQQLGREGRRSPRKLALSVVAAGLAIGGGYCFFAPKSSSSGAGSSDTSPRDPRLQEAENAVYAAMDSGDVSQADRVAQDLHNEDAGLRLAAVRFLAKVAPDDYRGELIAATKDTDKRVRMAAVQLVGDRLAGPVVAQSLLAISKDSERETGERILAMKALERRPEGVQPVDLLPLLLDPASALRTSASGLLVKLTGEHIEATRDPNELHAAWSRLLGRTS